MNVPGDWPYGEGMRALLALLLLAGCGPAAPDLVGTWEGMLTQDDVPCRGQYGRHTDAWALKLEPGGAGLKLTNEPVGVFGCASVPLTVVGEVATAAKTSCDSAAAVVEIGGTLTLKGDTLTVALKNHTAFKPPETFQCDFTVDGVLTRKATPQ